MNQAFVVTGMPRRLAARSWWDEVVFALSKPFSGMGVIMIAFGVALSFAMQLPVFILPIAAALTYFWLYHNYFFKTIEVASNGSEELPDSPSGHEAMGFLQLLGLVLGTYLGLGLPLLAVVGLAQLSPFLAGHMLPAVLAALAWPVVAYPMTLLLATHTKNPFTAFHYPSLCASMVRAAPSYAAVLAFWAVLGVAPHALFWFWGLKEGRSEALDFGLGVLRAGWSLYSMMALGLFLGRFYVREKQRLGWFA